MEVKEKDVSGRLSCHLGKRSLLVRDPRFESGREHFCTCSTCLTDIPQMIQVMHGKDIILKPNA